VRTISGHNIIGDLSIATFRFFFHLSCILINLSSPIIASIERAISSVGEPITPTYTPTPNPARPRRCVRDSPARQALRASQKRALNERRRQQHSPVPEESEESSSEEEHVEEGERSEVEGHFGDDGSSENEGFSRDEGESEDEGHSGDEAQLDEEEHVVVEDSKAQLSTPAQFIKAVKSEDSYVEDEVSWGTFY